MSESNIQRLIQLRASQLGMRLFRNNTGRGWIGERMQAPPVYGKGAIILLNARPLHAGLCVGSADLIGWTDRGQFLAVEVKTSTGRATPEQLAFLEAVNRAGGRGFVARSETDLG